MNPLLMQCQPVLIGSLKDSKDVKGVFKSFLIDKYLFLKHKSVMEPDINDIHVRKRYQEKILIVQSSTTEKSSYLSNHY